MNRVPTKVKRRRRRDQPIQLKIQKNKKTKRMENNPNNCDIWI